MHLDETTSPTVLAAVGVDAAQSVSAPAHWALGFVVYLQCSSPQISCYIHALNSSICRHCWACLAVVGLVTGTRLLMLCKDGVGIGPCPQLDGLGAYRAHDGTWFFRSCPRTPMCAARPTASGTLWHVLALKVRCGAFARHASLPVISAERRIAAVTQKWQKIQLPALCKATVRTDAQHVRAAGLFFCHADF